MTVGAEPAVEVVECPIVGRLARSTSLHDLSCPFAGLLGDLEVALAADQAIGVTGHQAKVCENNRFIEIPPLFQARFDPAGCATKDSCEVVNVLFRDEIAV